MADQKFLSVFMDRFLPDFLRTEYVKYEKFIRYYLEYCEQNGKVVQLIYDFLHYIDIDAIDESDPYNSDGDVLQQYCMQYISSFPLYRITQVDVKRLIKNAKDFYSSKGTEKSYDFIFRLMNHMGAFSFYYPGNDIFIISNAHCKTDDVCKIHDNYYRAYYTYEIQSTLYGYVELKDIIEMLLHPAGCKCFFLRIVEMIGSLIPSLQLQSPYSLAFAYEIFSVYQWSNFDTYNLIYEANSITFEDLEDQTYSGILRGIGKMTFYDWGDTFSNIENSATNFNYYPHQLSAYLTVL
jgi:hypothetical protein